MSPEPELGLRMIEAVRASGFDVDREYASPSAMIVAVRRMDGFAADAELSREEESCLLENFRQVVLQTMRSGQVRSIANQSRRPRWRYLRVASPAAADGYSAALSLAGIEVPAWLRRG